MLTVWEPRTSVGNAEDQLKANLLINERLVEGENTDHLTEHFTAIRPTNVGSVGANAHRMGAENICRKRRRSVEGEPTDRRDTG